AQPKTDRRSGTPAEHLDQPVVAAASPQGVLLSFPSRHVELHGGARVVVEAAHEAMVDGVLKVEAVEQLPQPVEVRTACVAKEIQRFRCAGGDLQVEVLVIEHAERVDRK